MYNILRMGNSISYIRITVLNLYVENERLIYSFLYKGYFLATIYIYMYLQLIYILAGLVKDEFYHTLLNNINYSKFESTLTHCEHSLEVFANQMNNLLRNSSVKGHQKITIDMFAQSNIVFLYSNYKFCKYTHFILL